MIMNSRNRLILISFILKIQILFGQISIGKANVDGSGLIDFQSETTKGIVLSHVEDVNKMHDISEGTFVYDEFSAKVMFFDGETWIDMNGVDGLNPSKLETIESSSKTGMIIGNDTTDAIGILVLESDDRALILPKIENPAKNVKSPYAGMICYDTLSDNLYMFNGKYWTFWGIEEDDTI